MVPPMLHRTDDVGLDRRIYTRIDFLMRYLAWHVGEPLEVTVEGLRRNLEYTIPPGVPDPDRRYWHDPVVAELSTVILAATLDDRRTTGFSLRGRGRLAGLGLHSCGCSATGALCWTTAFDIRCGEPIGIQTYRVVDALWSDPSWRQQYAFDFAWLEPWPRGTEPDSRRPH
jgi:hypothetical protein